MYDSILQYVTCTCTDIDEKSITLNTTELCSKIMEIFSDVKESEIHKYRDYIDDVRYCPYFLDGHWMAICVQDFDLQDYDEELFLKDAFPNGDISTDVISCYRNILYCLTNLSISECDALAKRMAEVICKYAKPL